MPNVVLIPRENPLIEALSTVVDGYPEMSHKLETSSGGAPLETGAEVTDHAFAREEQLRLTGSVSDFTDIRGARASDAWATIRRLHREVRPVEVYTPWGIYPEMIIRRAEATPVGLGMRFSLELQQILRVGIARGAILAASVSGPAVGRASQVERGRVLPIPLAAPQ